MVSRRCMSKPICPGWQGARTTALLGCFAFACSSSCTTVAADKAEPGLAVRFTALDSDKATATDLTVLPNVWPECRKASQLRLGREVFIEFRCAKCHAGPAPDTAIPELAMDAPTFEGIGSRRRCDWMARWIADPQALRPTAHMPALLRRPKAKEDAEAIAAFLASLNQGS